MIELEKKNKTLRNFKEAVRATGGKVNNSFKNPLALVGAFYDTTFLPKTILSEPSVAVQNLDDSSKDISFVVTLKPMPEDVDSLHNLDNFLNIVNMGDLFTSPASLSTGGKPLTPTQSYLAQNSVFSDVQNYELGISMIEPTVERVDTVINGVKYWQFTVTDSVSQDGEEVYKHAVHFLFKEKTGEGENFFSSLVGKQLNKRDTFKVLDTLEGKNLSGFFLGGVTIGAENKEHRAVSTSMYATGSEMMLRTYSDDYVFQNATGATTIKKELLEGAHIERVGSYKYNLILHTGKDRVTVYIG